jgi:hypothetical protein
VSILTEKAERVRSTATASLTHPHLVVLTHLICSTKTWSSRNLRFSILFRTRLNMNSKGWFNLETAAGTIPETQFFEGESAFSSLGLTRMQRLYGFAGWCVVTLAWAWGQKLTNVFDGWTGLWGIFLFVDFGLRPQLCHRDDPQLPRHRDALCWRPDIFRRCVLSSTQGL